MLSFRAVIPSLNQGAYLDECLASIFNQNYSGTIEVALMDGGSSDGSLEIIRKYKEDLSYYQSQKDDGQSHALMVGFNFVEGDISFYLNSDDVLLPDTFKKVSEIFQENPDLDFIYSHRLIVNENSEIFDYWNLPNHRRWIIRQTDLIPQETLFWRSDIMKRVGSFDPKLQFAMDYDFILRLIDFGKGKRIPDFFAAFRYHTQSKTYTTLTTIGAAEIKLLRERYKVRNIKILEKFLSGMVRWRTKLWRRYFAKRSKYLFFGRNLSEIWADSGMRNND